MKLWILRPVDPDAGFWDPWFDKAFGFVVRAETEERAREIAQSYGGDEIGYGNKKKPAWTDPQHSTCKPLTEDGVEELVMKDFNAA